MILRLVTNHQQKNKNNFSQTKKIHGREETGVQETIDQRSLRKLKEHPGFPISETKIGSSPPSVMVMETPPCGILTKDRTPVDSMEDPEVRSRSQHSSRS